ncbi:protein kinase subdomain-containing protein pkl ccin9 [Moniliophthora roreri MCA 2997]|uniref:Protein kinase subdomain-containing protein pkl ccin9 n=1 Tax=Moniliophthora roreri (strain MCA 2997) TaxID=1381753 RepID=V2WKF9_MONRO|nr:protein kinase subdomain-containing protein pkl ccin9 [Moniliophthora roreri MCA 2997]
MIVRCSYIAFIGSPTPQNIEIIQIVADVVEVKSTGFIFNLRKEIFANHPQLWGTSATFHKASWDKHIVVDGITDIEIAPFSNKTEQDCHELYLDDIIHEVFGIAADEILPWWSLIVCFEHSNQLAVTPATVVGQLKWDFKKYTKAVISGRSLSVTVKSTNYNKNQASDTALLDGRFNAFGKATTALSIELYHPAFANFSSNACDSNLQVPNDDLCTTAKLI